MTIFSQLHDKWNPFFEEMDRFMRYGDVCPCCLSTYPLNPNTRFSSKHGYKDCTDCGITFKSFEILITHNIVDNNIYPFAECKVGDWLEPFNQYGLSYSIILVKIHEDFYFDGTRSPSGILVPKKNTFSSSKYLKVIIPCLENLKS